MSKEKQTTALSQLIEKLISRSRENDPYSFTLHIYFEANKDLIDEAKAIERQQIEDAYDSAIMKGRQEDGKQYFIETFTQ
jgi:hypothetical protein